MKKVIFGMQYAPPVSNNLMNGLLAFYKLDSNGNDSSGGHNLNTQFITYQPAKLGNGAFTNPSSGANKMEAAVGSNFNISQSGFSISLWVRFNAMPWERSEWLVSKNNNPDNPSPSYRNFDVSRFGQLLYFSVYVNNETSNIDWWYNATHHQSNTWIHIVMTHDGLNLPSSVKMYENGVPMVVNGGSTLPNFNAISGNLLLGNQNFYPAFGNNYLLQGALDEVGFWNRALSQLEVTRLYNLETYPFN